MEKLNVSTVGSILLSNRPQISSEKSKFYFCHWSSFNPWNNDYGRIFRKCLNCLYIQKYWIPSSALVRDWVVTKTLNCGQKYILVVWHTNCSKIKRTFFQVRSMKDSGKRVEGVCGYAEAVRFLADWPTTFPPTHLSKCMRWQTHLGRRDDVYFPAWHPWTAFAGICPAGPTLPWWSLQLYLQMSLIPKTSRIFCFRQSIPYWRPEQEGCDDSTEEEGGGAGCAESPN